MQLVRSGLLARPGSCIRTARARDDPLQARNLRGTVRVADEVPLISALELVDRVGGLERFDLLQCASVALRAWLAKLSAAIDALRTQEAQPGKLSRQ